MQEIPIQNRSEFMGKQGQQVPVSSSVSQGQQIPMGSSQVPVGSSTMSQQPGMMQQQGLGQQGLGQKTFGQQGMVDRFDHEKYDKYGKERHHRHRGPVDLFGTREQGFEQQEEGTYLPRVDIHELANTIQVDVELAGVPREKIHIEHNQDMLTIWGDQELKAELQGAERKWYRRERHYGRFKRQIQLPRGIDHNLITAVAKDGILSLAIPRPREPELQPPRQIPVL